MILPGSHRKGNTTFSGQIYIVIVHLHEVEVPLVKQNNDSANPSNTHLETQELQLGNFEDGDYEDNFELMNLTTTHWSVFSFAVTSPPFGLRSAARSAARVTSNYRNPTKILTQRFEMC